MEYYIDDTHENLTLENHKICSFFREYRIITAVFLLILAVSRLLITLYHREEAEEKDAKFL